jgi:hypothetical protein
MAIRKAQWKTNTQFAYTDALGGSVAPDFDGTEIVGIGASACIQLEDEGTASDDVPFTNPANYIYDPTKIDVAGGRAALVATALNSYNWPFTNPANYTYDPSKIEVTAGVARLKGSPLAPYAWWHLNEAAGFTANDSSGNGRNGTLINMESPGDWVPGKLNNCLRFDGVNEYVDCGNIANFERNVPFSVEFWCKTSTASRMIMSKCNGTVGWEIYIATGGKIFFSLNSNTGTVDRITRYSLSSVTDGAWHHVVCTYDGSSDYSGMKIYVDNVEEANSGTNSLTASILSGVNLNIARRPTGILEYNGDLDEIVIYSQELSAAEVAYRWNAGAGTEIMPGAYPSDDPDIVTNNGWAFFNPISSFAVTSTIPAHTGIQYQLSSDDGVTWKWWNGMSWVAITGGQTDTWYYNNESNDALEVHSNIADLAVAGTLKIRSFLHTSDHFVRPELDNILVEEGASYPVGSWPIEMNTDIQPSRVAQWIQTTETVIKPANTDIEYQYSIDSGVSWNGTWLTESQLETAVQSIATVGDGTDRIRFKFQLTTSAGNRTPVIDNLNIAYNRGYKLTGTYTSTVYRPYPAYFNGIYLETIEFEVVDPSGTTVTIRFRPSVHALAEWPDKPWPQYNNGDDLAVCADEMQWEATLTTDHPLKTPKVNWLEISYHLPVGILKNIDDNTDFVKKLEEGKWDLTDLDGGTWIAYEEDNITEVARFATYDKDGNRTNVPADIVTRVRIPSP